MIKNIWLPGKAWDRSSGRLEMPGGGGVLGVGNAVSHVETSIRYKVCYMRTLGP